MRKWLFFVSFGRQWQTSPCRQAIFLIKLVLYKLLWMAITNDIFCGVVWSCWSCCMYFYIVCLLFFLSFLCFKLQSKQRQSLNLEHLRHHLNICVLSLINVETNERHIKKYSEQSSYTEMTREPFKWPCLKEKFLREFPCPRLYIHCSKQSKPGHSATTYLG